MDLSFLLDNAVSVGLVLGVSLFFLAYYRVAKVKEVVDYVMPFLPQVLKLVGGLLKDKEGKWDAHDAAVLMGRVSEKLQAALSDVTNKNFEDVEEEVYNILRDELENFKGQKGVPDVNDVALRAQVRVIFEQIKKASQ